MRCCTHAAAAAHKADVLRQALVALAMKLAKGDLPLAERFVDRWIRDAERDVQNTHARRLLGTVSK